MHYPIRKLLKFLKLNQPPELQEKHYQDIVQQKT